MRFKGNMVNIMSRSSIWITLLGVFGLVFGLTDGALADTLPYQAGGFSSLSGPSALPKAGLIRISNRSLSAIRGGFSPPDNPGVFVDLGFSIQTLVNGKPVQNLTGDVNNITQTVTPTISFQDIKNTAPSSSNTSSTDSTTSGGKAFTTVTSSQIQGNSQLATTIVNTIGSSGVTTMIQNQANDQVIQEARTLNLNITGMQTQLLNAAQATQIMHALTLR